MKRVILNRSWHDSRATLGMLKIEGVEHSPIFTLENPQRKTLEDCLIPAGEYECEPYSGTKYKDVYKVLDVPGRTDILFHWGNWEKNTLGCILLGLGSGMMKGEPAVSNSKKAIEYFRGLIGDEKFKLIISQ